MKNSLSIIIPTWNGKKYLKFCLESLRSQTNKNFEIIVVDNGSSDGTKDYLNDNYPEVSVLVLSKNFGFAAAVNIGIKNAKNEYVFLLNNDIELHKECVEDILNNIKFNDLSVLGCRIMDFEKRDTILDLGNVYSIFGLVIQESRGEKDEYKKNEIKEVFSVCAGAAVYKKEIFKKIGYFDEDFFAYLEDVDIGFRLQLAGYRAFLSDKSIVYHVEGATSERFSDFKEYLSLRNNLYLIIKNFPIILLALLSPFIILYQIRTLIVFIRQKKLNLFTKAYVDFLKNIVSIIKKRRLIQKNRRVTVSYILRMMSKEVPFKLVKKFRKKL